MCQRLAMWHVLVLEGREGEMENWGCGSTTPQLTEVTSTVWDTRWVNCSVAERLLLMRRVDNSGDKGGGWEGPAPKRFCKGFQGLLCERSSYSPFPFSCPKAGPVPSRPHLSVGGSRLEVPSHCSLEPGSFLPQFLHVPRWGYIIHRHGVGGRQVQ